VLEPSVQNRAFFNERIAQHCGGDRAKAETVPMVAFVKAVLEIHELESAERFLAGHVHWLRGRRPRTMEEVLRIARANIAYVFDEKMLPADVELWSPLIEVNEETVPPSKQAPEEAFKASAAIGEQIKAGKDPGLAAMLAKKALQKKAAAR